MSTPGNGGSLPAYQGQAEFLEGFLRAVRDGLRRRAAARVLWWVPAGMLAAAGVALAADAAFGCPAAWRGVLYAALLAASAGASAALVFGAWLRRPSPLYVARLIERARPDLKNALITFLELAREPGEDPSARAAVGRRAARILGEMQPTAVLPPYDRRPAALAAAGLAGLVAAGLWLAQGVFIAPWVPGAQASVTGHVGSGGPHATRGTAADAVASAGAGAAAQSPGAPDGSGAGEGSARAADGAAQAPSASGADANSGRGGAGEGAGDGAGASPGQGGSGTGAGDGAGDGGSAQALASAVRGDQSTFDRLARALGQQGIGSAEPAPGSAAPPPGGAGEGTGRGAPGSPDSGGRGKPDATQAETPSAAAGEAGEGGTSRPDGRGAGTEAGASPGAGGSGGSATTQAGRRDRPPIPPRPQGRDFPPEALDALRAARRIIEKADRRLQDGGANDGFLGEIGMSRQECRRFVVAWKRRFETAAAGPDATAAPEATRAAAAPPAAEVLQPGRADAARAVRGGESGAADATELFAGDETAVSPRLRPAVSAYFEALGRLARERAKSLSE